MVIRLLLNRRVTNNPSPPLIEDNPWSAHFTEGFKVILYRETQRNSLEVALLCLFVDCTQFPHHSFGVDTLESTAVQRFSQADHCIGMIKHLNPALGFSGKILKNIKSLREGINQNGRQIQSEIMFNGILKICRQFQEIAFAYDHSHRKHSSRRVVDFHRST